MLSVCGPLREGPAMKVLASLVAGLMPVHALAADTTCRAEVVSTKLSREEVRAFMEDCKALAQMVCEGRAIGQKIPDQAKASFLKTCLAAEMGK